MTDFDRIREINRLAKILVDSTNTNDEFYDLRLSKIRLLEDVLCDIQNALDDSVNELRKRGS